MYARVFFVICVLLVADIVAESRRWFALEVSCWITQEKVPASWEDAQRRCERDGATLASPLNTQLFNYMQSLINLQNHSAAYFIGTRAVRSDDGQEVHYVSEEGRRLAEMPRAVFDAIDQLDLDQGDCLSMDRHGIRAVSCWNHLPYICYSNETMECGSALATTLTPSTSEATTTVSVTSTITTAPTTTTTARPLTVKIPSGYTYKAATGSYYKFHKMMVSWHVAHAKCASEGAHLVVLNSAEEADIVKGIMREVSYGDGMWIGLRDDGLGGISDWRTVRGETVSEVYHEWRNNHPYKNAGYSCCVFSTFNHDLVDWGCEGTFYVTCEISQ